MSSKLEAELITEISVNLQVIDDIRKEMWYDNEDQKDRRFWAGEYCGRCNIKSKSSEGGKCYCDDQIDLMLNNINKKQRNYSIFSFQNMT